MKGNLDKNSLREAERNDPRRRTSQRKRKLVERVFGCPSTTVVDNGKLKLLWVWLSGLGYGEEIIGLEA